MTNILEYLENTIKTISDPDKAAFISQEMSMSFQKLYDSARSCGTYLAETGINKQPVAVFMEKSPAMIAAFLGVAYSGNYYIPLDPEMPAFRIKMILENADPAVIVCDEVTKKLLKDNGAVFSSALCSFGEIRNHPVDSEALEKLRKKSIDADPLYVVFTSGSTGVPKGVVATHRSVIDYVENLCPVLGVSENTVFGNQSPLYLDACLKEIFPTLKFGATAYLIPQSLFMFPVKLIEYINEKGINTICWVASALSLVAGLGALGSKTPDSLHTVAFGSEIFPIKQYNIWREALPNARFIHLYGPTEATGMSCFYETMRTYELDEAIPIGYPFPNTEIILLGDNGEITAVDEVGEICIRGTCLSPGYFGDFEKTADAFVQNPNIPFTDIIYKTGDLGRYGKKGELYFISRRDYQIKHMGYRIELAEIELMASALDDVSLVCTVFDDVKSKIILYYISDSVEKSALKSYLKENLPRYMQPHQIFRADTLPRTPGGKIDRVELLRMYSSIAPTDQTYTK